MQQLPSQEPGEEQLFSSPGKGSCSCELPRRSRGSCPPLPSAPPLQWEEQLPSQEPRGGAALLRLWLSDCDCLDDAVAGVVSSWK